MSSQEFQVDRKRKTQKDTHWKLAQEQQPNILYRNYMFFNINPKY